MFLSMPYPLGFYLWLLSRSARTVIKCSAKGHLCGVMLQYQDLPMSNLKEYRIQAAHQEGQDSDRGKQHYSV